MNNPKFQMFKSTLNNEYYYRFLPRNGEIILYGEGYKSSQSCLNGIASVKENAPLNNRYVRKNAYLNYTFNLKAANGQIINIL